MLFAEIIADGTGDVPAPVAVARRRSALGASGRARGRRVGHASDGPGGAGRRAGVVAGRGRLQRAVARDPADIRRGVGRQARRGSGGIVAAVAQPCAAAQRGRHGAGGAGRARLQPR